MATNEQPRTVPPLDSAVAVARRLGLRVGDPVVLRDGLNLIVRLDPAPVVARVALRTARVRTIEPLADSLALARHLHAEGLPVGATAADVDPGPHVGPGGWRMTLWQHLEVLETDPDPTVVGRTLRAIHEAAVRYDGPLRHVGPLEETRRLVDAIGNRRPAEVTLVRQALASLRLPDLPTQPLHGDAHLHNVVRTPVGHRWVDWEESWRGPVAWDLACLDHRRRVMGELTEPIGRALDAYGPYDEAAVAAYGDLLTVWAGAWGVLIAAETGVLGDGTRRRLAWLRASAG